MRTRQTSSVPFAELFLDLIEICDSFDQLGKLAVILDKLYEPTDPPHQKLFQAIEKTARHLRGLPLLQPGCAGCSDDCGSYPCPDPTTGDQGAAARAFVPACAAEHCPCPVPCTDESK